jgi:hypothetical protein
MLATPDLEGACRAGEAGQGDDPSSDDVTDVVDPERDAVEAGQQHDRGA